MDNPYEFYLTEPTWVEGTNKSTIVYSLENYYEKIPNYYTITELPEENANYIKEALPNVDDCSGMLNYCKKLTSVDTTGWDTSKITNMAYMFGSNHALTTLDVSKWDTSKVIDMSLMFFICSSLTNLNASKWDTSKVTNMDYMFSNCTSLTTLDISNWDTSNVTSMYYMFYDCNALTTLDISNWDTSNVTDMGEMFYSCSSLTTITGTIDMKSCASYSEMFTSCSNLSGVKIKNPPAGITATSGIGGLAAGKYEIVS